MTLHLENSPRTAGTRRLLVGLATIAGLVCGVSGAGNVFAQGQQTRAAAAPPVPPVAPAAATAPVAPPPPSALAHRIVTLGSGPSSYVFKSRENGREFELRLENDEVVSARADGQDIPKDRVVREGNTVLFKDEQGNTIFEHAVSRPHELRIATTIDPFSGATTPSRIVIGQNMLAPSGTIPGPDQDLFVEAEPPKVMLGVTMLEPDTSLLGHFGLEPGASTLVGVVYEGLPADAAGLEPYDIIVSVNGKKPASQEAIRKALRELNPGDEVKFTIIHRGKERDAMVKLEKYDRARFDESKAKKMAMVADQDSLAMAEAKKLRARMGPSSGAFVGIAPDPNNPNAVYFSAPGMNSQQLQQALAEAQVRAEAQLDRARQLQDQLFDKSNQAKGMEDRMRRLEELLQKLLEDRGVKKEGGGGAGAPPVPDALAPATGLWVWRNPAA